MKTACAVQCPQCPFRPNALPGWLGDYKAAEIPPLLWRNGPFLCHTKVQYDNPRAFERAKTHGKLCRGALAFATRMRIPAAAGRYPEAEDADVIAARQALTEDDLAAVETMGPVDFVKHHTMTAAERAAYLKLKRASSQP